MGSNPTATATTSTNAERLLRESSAFRVLVSFAAGEHLRLAGGVGLATERFRVLS